MRQQTGMTAGISPTSSGAGRLPSLIPPSSHHSQPHGQHNALVPFGGVGSHIGLQQGQAAPSGRHSGLSNTHFRLQGHRNGAGGVMATSPTFLGNGASPSELNLSSVSAPSGLSGLSGMLFEGHNGPSRAPHGVPDKSSHKRQRHSSGSHGSLSDLIKSRRK